MLRRRSSSKHKMPHRVEQYRQLKCGRKVCYKTRNIARNQAGRSKAMSGRMISVYACELCGQWHLTSKMKPND